MLVEAVLELLPVDGQPILFEALVRLGREHQIEAHAVGKALALLCAAERATSRDVGGHHLVRRVIAGQAPPIVPRPQSAPPRRARFHRAAG